MYRKEYMQEAIRIARENVEKGGGPFGAVVVRNGEIIAASGNTVVPDNDPTAHAEVNAIREACRVMASFQLDGCEIYCSCEPCPMCFGAIYWARPEKVYYAASKEDAAVAGFDDSYIYKEITIEKEQRSIPFVRREESGSGSEFSLWIKDIGKRVY